MGESEDAARKYPPRNDKWMRWANTYNAAHSLGWLDFDPLAFEGRWEDDLTGPYPFFQRKMDRNPNTLPSARETADVNFLAGPGTTQDVWGATTPVERLTLTCAGDEVQVQRHGLSEPLGSLRNAVRIKKLVALHGGQLPCLASLTVVAPTTADKCDWQLSAFLHP